MTKSVETQILLLFCFITLLFYNSLHASYEQFQIIGEPIATHGCYDVSIEYEDSGAIGWMVYSAVSLPWVHTHLAKTTDHGQTWEYVKAINTGVGEQVTIFGTPTIGIWRHEVPAIVHDPTDTGKEWKLFWHHYFTREPYNSDDRIFQYGWIAYKYASTPDGTWSEEIPLLGAGSFPPSPYSTPFNLNTLDSRLANMICYTEPGCIEKNGVIYLALQAHSANTEEQNISLFSTTDPVDNWNFIDILSNSTIAHGIGYIALHGPSLVEEKGRQFILLSPEIDKTTEYQGTLIAEFEDLATGSLYKDDQQNLKILRYLPPSYVTFNAGQSDYDEQNTGGGIIMPQVKFTPQPTIVLEFQLWNTHQKIIEDYTPTTTPTVTPTETPASNVPSATPTPEPFVAYPNPASDKVFFKFIPTTNGEIEISIYNMAGEPVLRMTETVNENPMVVECDIHALSPGMYIYYVKSNCFPTKKGKMVKLGK